MFHLIRKETWGPSPKPYNLLPTPTRTLHLHPEGDSFRSTVPPITPGMLSQLQTLTQKMADMVQTWLQALQAWHGPSPNDFHPRLHPQVECLFAGDEGAMVAWKGRHWCLHPTRYGPDHAQVLRLIQQGTSLADMEASRPDARSLVQELGCELVIDCFQDPSNPSRISKA